MSMPVFISSFGAVSHSGIFSPRGFTPWLPGIADAGTVERSHVLSKPYVAFGKLTRCDKLAFAAAALALENNTGWQGDQTALCIDMPWGSFSTDVRYQETITNGFPSPALFSSTLPSSALADITIYYKIKGPNRVLSDGRQAGYGALEQALSILEHKKAETCLAIALCCVEPCDRDLSVITATPLGPDYVVALLLTTTPGPMELSLAPTDTNHPSSPESTQPYMLDLVQAVANQTPATLSIATNAGYKSIILK